MCLLVFVIDKIKTNNRRNIMKKVVTNPYLPNFEYVPDGEPHVFKGRVYV